MKLKLNIRFFVLIAAVLFSDNLSAQITQQRLENDPVTGAGIFRPYFLSVDEVASMSSDGGADMNLSIYLISEDMVRGIIPSRNHGSTQLTV